MMALKGKALEWEREDHEAMKDGPRQLLELAQEAREVNTLYAIARRRASVSNWRVVPVAK